MLNDISRAKLAVKASYLSKKLDSVSQKYVFVECDSPELLNECHALRHQVYCKEFAWQPETHSRYEQDSFDPHATHYGVFDKDTGQVVATFRIIKGKRLPVNQVGLFSTGNIYHPSRRNAESICEFSRFSILKEHRNSDLSCALILFAMFSAIKSGYTTMYSMMENKFANRLKKLEISVSQLTDTFEYNGARAVYMVSDTDLLPLLSAMTGGSLALPKLERLFAKLGSVSEPSRYCA